jgi:hypothetical protein
MSAYALMYVRVAIPPTHTPEQAVAEVQKSICFGQPKAVLLGHWTVEHPEGSPVISWSPTADSPDDIADLIVEPIWLYDEPVLEGDDTESSEP